MKKNKKMSMQKRLRQAYIRGMIDLTLIVTTMAFYVWVGVYAVEKYFM